MALSTSGLHYCRVLQAEFQLISTPTALCRKKCLPILSPSAHRSWKKWLWKLSLLYLPAGFAVAHWWAWVFQGQEPKTGSSPASQIFLEVFPMLRGGSDAGGRKAGSRHLQQWCFLRVSALPELMSCWGAGSGSQESFFPAGMEEWMPWCWAPRFCTEERQSDGTEGGRLCCVWSSQDRQCAVQPTQTGLACWGMAGGSWAAGDLLNLLSSLVPKGYNISWKAQDVSKAPN